MCGIAGLMTFGTHCVSRELLAGMTGRLAHRGPDDAGLYISPSGQVGLGSRRLSIQDLSAAGHMPMADPKRSTWLVFNGEIYNFLRLRSELAGRGHSFVSGSDTEVIIHLYQERGLAFLDDLEGMFALALWDEEREFLLLARDRLGEKPVYYADYGGVFRFASEIKALLLDDSLPRSADLASLNEYLTFGFVQPPGTMFNRISKLAPGERLILGRNGRPDLARYWEPLADRARVSQIRQQSAADHVSAIRWMLEQSVEACLVADVPVGAFLSGGLDSSATVSLMSRKLGRPVESVTVSYPAHPDRDELSFAESVARYTGARLHPVIVRPCDAEEAFPDCIDHLDEPVSDPACVNTFLAAKHLRALGVPVAVVGEGADELFLGYPSYLKLRWLWPWWRAGRELPEFVRRPIFTATMRLLGPGVLPAHRDLLRRAAHAEGFFLSTDPFFPDGDKLGIVGGALAELAARRPSTALTERMTKGVSGLMQGDLLAQMSLAEVRMRMAEQLLMRVDKLSMAHAVEVRAPFLNWRLADYALALPGPVRAAGGRPKALLKRALADLVPEKTLRRPKMGFGTAVDAWCRTWAGARLRHHLESSELFRSGIISAPQISNLLADHDSGAKSRHTRLWNILCLSEWWERFSIRTASVDAHGMVCH